jgi:hypothetical protein
LNIVTSSSQIKRSATCRLEMSDLVWVSSTQYFERKQDLACLAPEHGLVATDAFKGSVVDFGKPQETARNIGNDLAAWLRDAR